MLGLQVIYVNKMGARYVHLHHTGNHAIVLVQGNCSDPAEYG